MPALPDGAFKLRSYSALATVMHAWRDNAAARFTRWVDVYKGADAAQSRAHLVPPRPISGRWGQQTHCE
eukprot:900839-Pyramimonas_sp.AAC.1